MAILKASIPYANSLFQLAKSKNEIAPVKADMEMIQSLIQSDPAFRDLISNPTISKAKKVEILNAIFKGKVQPMTLEFLNLLVRKNRLDILDSIATVYIQLSNEEEHIVVVHLSTAVEMPKDVQEQIVKKYIPTKKTEIHSEVKPWLIGGYVIEYDNKIIDQSIQYKVQQFKNELVK